MKLVQVLRQAWIEYFIYARHFDSFYMEWNDEDTSKGALLSRRQIRAVHYNTMWLGQLEAPQHAVGFAPNREENSFINFSRMSREEY